MSLGIDIRVISNLSASERLLAKKRKRSGRLKKGFIQAALIYRKAMQIRHARNARGGGEWVARADGKTPILRKTDTLYKELSQSRSKGNITVGPNNDVVTIAYSERRHPEFKGTIGGLAHIHHFGTLRGGRGHIPSRPLLIRPRGQVLERMTDELRKALRDIARGKSA